MQRGTTAPAQLLGASQERALWEEQLAVPGMHPEAPLADDSALTLHAAALMSAAQRATQSHLALAGTAQSREEQLLAGALRAVRATCAERNLLSLRLAPAETLSFLAGTPAPLIVGEPRLTALQQWLSRRFWPNAQVLQPLPTAPAACTVKLRAGDARQELAACATWCREQLARDPEARLLVLSASIDPPLAIQSQLLWNGIAGDASSDMTLRERWLVVEGGEALPHLALVADALLALELADADQGVDVARLLELLRSPYFHFGTVAEVAALARWLGATGLATMDHSALRRALNVAAADLPVATRLLQWLDSMQSLHRAPQRQDATSWATAFAKALADAGFASPQRLDPRALQHLDRWHGLLDEFAALDAVIAPMSAVVALARLRRLAAHSRHQVAARDAAITFSGRLGDPVAGYDGIWVLGLSEDRWPTAPRPDPWVPLLEQRRAGWQEASASGRRQQAQWAMQCWQARTTSLVLSHAAQEGEVIHRATSLLDSGGWIEAGEKSGYEPQLGLAVAGTDLQMAVIEPAQLAQPLAGGASRLETHQSCPFRAQARWRLAAEPPAGLCDGIPAWLRGRLLHALLDRLWEQLGNQSALLALDNAAEQQLLAGSWSAAVRDTREAAWLPANVLERERIRTLRLAVQVLELERQRAPFTVQQRELGTRWEGTGAQLSLRIDRVDRVGDAAVLLDYKSGAAPVMKLHEGTLQPLQLALYADALTRQGQPIDAAVLLNLHPARSAFTGVTGQAGQLPGRVHEIAGWESLLQSWHADLQQLMARHLAGEATLAIDRKACVRCHLPALCRRAGTDAADTEALEAEDE